MERPPRGPSDSFARAILFTTGHIFAGSNDPVSLLTVPAGRLGNPTVAKVLCLASSVGVCPDGFHVVHITAVGTSATPQEDLSQIVKALTRLPGGASGTGTGTGTGDGHGDGDGAGAWPAEAGRWTIFS
jgi:hypothetical protein